MTKPALIILAAGMGSRYGGLKQLDIVGPGGETIMDYSIYDAIRAGFGEIVFIVKENFLESLKQQVYEKYGNRIKFSFVIQELSLIPKQFNLNPDREKPWGTGHATLLASDVIHGNFAVINADDYYGQLSFKVLAEYLVSMNGKSGEYSMVGFLLGNTLSESGTVSRGICSVNSDGYLTSVEEHHNIGRKGDVIEAENGFGTKVIAKRANLVSMNMWGFTPDIFEKGEELFCKFLEERGNELKSEFYIPFMVNETLKTEKARCKVLNTNDKWFGVTYKEDKEYVVSQFKELAETGIYPVPLFGNE